MIRSCLAKARRVIAVAGKPRKDRMMKKSDIDIEQFSTIKEGLATVLAPKEDKVFYNHIQQFNRDLSVMGIKAWSQMYQESKKGEQEMKKRKLDKYIHILEALSATGLRAMRYGHEIEQVKRVVANDLLPEAVKSIDRNIVYNELEDVVKSNEGDAMKFMASTNEKFHVVDLDPYGTAAPFIDSALQCIKDEGLLIVTCTDAGVLAGSGYPEKCFALYGGHNFGNTFMGSESNHEAGMRLMLNLVATTASKYKKSIEPLLSLSIDYYFRIFIRVRTSPIEVKRLASNTMLTYHCIGCGDKLLQPLGRINENKFQTPKLATNIGSKCSYCDSQYHIAGPMWMGGLHSHQFIDRVLEINKESDPNVYGTRERVKGMLTLAKNELREPFYFNLNQVSSFFKSPPIPIKDFVTAIGNMGFNTSLTHAKKNCMKTDAPWTGVLAILAAWLRKSNLLLLEEMKSRPNQNDKTLEKIKSLEADISTNPNLTSGMTGYKILAHLKEHPSNINVDFDTENEMSSNVNALRKLKMVRYQENPTKNWGPKARPSD